MILDRATRDLNICRCSSDKKSMYIHGQPSAILTVAAPTDTSVLRDAGSQPLKLLPFQIVRATVAEAGMDKVVLNLKHHQLTADTKVPLKKGQSLNLQVLNTEPQIQLKIMDTPELRHLFRALHLFHQNIKLPVLLHQLQKTSFPSNASFPERFQHLLKDLEFLFGANPGKFTGKSIISIWTRLGLDFEALLWGAREKEAFHGLKAMLLKYADGLRQQGKSSETADRVLELLKLYQLCRFRLAQENILFVPLPFSFLEQGYLLAEKRDQGDKNKSGRQQSWKMILNLKFSFLGNLQIYLLFENLDLRLRILCDSDDKAEIISKSLTGLKKNLTSVSLLGVSVASGAEDPGKFMIRKLVQDEENILRTEV